MSHDYTLYLVTEESVPVGNLLQIVEQAVKGGVTMVQLREKKTDGKLFYEKAAKLKELLDRYSVPLIINDRIDVALAVDAAGVHVGQSDMPLPAIKKIVPPNMLVGVSVSTVEEAMKAEMEGAAYIGVGAIFPTQSKDNAKVLPAGMLESIIGAVNIPIVAIGGIKIDNLLEIREKEIAGIAVVSGIMQAESPFAAAKEFRQTFKENLLLG